MIAGRLLKNGILITALLGLFTLAAEARDIAPGTLMVTGDTNLDIGSSKTTVAGNSITSDATKLNVAGAYFVARNVGVGLMLNSEANETDDGATVSKEAMSMLGPIVGYNISLNGNSSIMLHGALFVVNGDVDDGAGFKADIEGNGYMFGGGYNYFFNDHVALNVGLRLVKADLDFSSGGTTNSAELRETATNIGLSTFF